VLDSDEASERRLARTRALTDLARLEKRAADKSGAELPLSSRQLEIVMAVVRHGRVQAAAAALGVSRNSVYVGLRRAVWRLGLSDIDELLAMARDRAWPFHEGERVP
jgi:DNA-binding NarL/FixJ family response regulator